MKTSALVLAGLLSVPALGSEIKIESLTELEAAMDRVKPGDVLVLPAGEWRDVSVVFEAKGSPGMPIALRGAPEGKTVLSGKSVLRIAGEHLVVDGIHFRDSDPGVEVIEFRNGSKRIAQNCRLTNCAIVASASESQRSAPISRWVNLYGVNNRIDHCSFEGKGNGGATLVVWLGAENTGKHRIDHNYFGPRPVLGRNGGETIRIGDSRTSMQSAQCIVERNLFERCDGEVECVSNKSCDNLYRENTFRAVVGTLTLRHGNRCTVEDNVFLGDFVKRTGGIRVIGEDHTIRGNHLQALTGDEARAALCFMMGVSGSAAHEYFQVKRARIEGNTIVDCKVPVVIGLSDHAKASLPPDDVVFVDNRIVSDKATIIDARCSIEGVRWSGNVFHGGVLGIPDREGIRWKAPEVKGVRPLDRAEVGPIWFR